MIDQIHAWVLRNLIRFYSNKYFLFDIPPNLITRHEPKLLSRYKTIRGREFMYLGKGKAVFT